MTVEFLINAYLDRGIDAVNDALKTVAADEKIRLMKSLEPRGFQIHWHYDNDHDGEVDFGIVVDGPQG